MYWIWEPILYLWLDSNPDWRRRFVSNHSFGRTSESAWNILACTEVSLSRNSKRTVILLQSLLEKKFWSSFLNLENTSKGGLTYCMKDICDKAWIRAVPSFTECHCRMHIHHLWKGREGLWSSGVAILEERTWIFKVSLSRKLITQLNCGTKIQIIFFIFPHFWWIASGKIIAIMIIPLQNKKKPYFDHMFLFSYCLLAEIDVQRDGWQNQEAD